MRVCICQYLEKDFWSLRELGRFKFSAPDGRARTKMGGFSSPAPTRLRDAPPAKVVIQKFLFLNFFQKKINFPKFLRNPKKVPFDAQWQAVLAQNSSSKSDLLLLQK